MSHNASSSKKRLNHSKAIVSSTLVSSETTVSFKCHHTQLCQRQPPQVPPFANFKKMRTSLRLDQLTPMHIEPTTTVIGVDMNQ